MTKAHNTITPDSHRPNHDEWSSASFVYPELDMLLDLGRAAKHPRYAFPHVNVERLAAAGTVRDLSATYAEALTGPFQNLELSEFERRLAAIYFDANSVPRPIEVRMIIADTLLSMGQPQRRGAAYEHDENRAGVVLSYGQVLRLLAAELSASPHPAISEIGEAIMYVLLP
jgi:hypothetical protein